MKEKIPQTAINGTSSLPEFDAALFAKWLEETGCAENTIGQYVRSASRWLSVLRTSDDRPAIAWLRWSAAPGEKRLTGFAVRKYETLLRAMGSEVDLGVPAKLPPSSRPDPHPIPRSTIREILLAAKSEVRDKHASYTVRVFISVLDELGLRRSEAFFGWSQVDFDAAEIEIHGKGGDTRRLPLTPRLVSLLSWLRKRSPAYPWCNAKGRRLQADTMYRRFKRLARHVGDPSLRLHWLRHGRLTAMAATPGGFDPINLCAFSGHRQVGSLMHYCAPQISRLRELLDGSLSHSPR